MVGTVTIVIPVFDDWASLQRVLLDISCCANAYDFHVIVVDDGSRSEPGANFPEVLNHGCIRTIEVIRLAVNLGHQRAIAVGLSVAAQNDDTVGVIVMDADGEDRPCDIPTLLTLALEFPDYAVLGRRGRRSEGWQFRLGYRAYKVLFRVLTGKTIDFGNFSLLPITAVRRLVRMPELWNNMAAAIMRSRLKGIRVSLDRGDRIAGQSHMNLSALVVHGLSAMSVYSDVIFVRMLFAAVLSGATAVLGLLSVLTIRLVSHYAIPGWASVVFGDLVIVLLQSIAMAVATTLVVLSNRSHRPIIPFLDTLNFIADRRRWIVTKSGSVERAVLA